MAFFSPEKWKIEILTFTIHFTHFFYHNMRLNVLISALALIAICFTNNASAQRLGNNLRTLRSFATECPTAQAWEFHQLQHQRPAAAVMLSNAVKARATSAGIPVRAAQAQILAELRANKPQRREWKAHKGTQTQIAALQATHGGCDADALAGGK